MPLSRNLRVFFPPAYNGLSSFQSYFRGGCHRRYTRPVHLPFIKPSPLSSRLSGVIKYGGVSKNPRAFFSFPTWGRQRPETRDGDSQPCVILPTSFLRNGGGSTNFMSLESGTKINVTGKRRRGRKRSLSPSDLLMLVLFCSFSAWILLEGTRGPGYHCLWCPSPLVPSPWSPAEIEPSRTCIKRSDV